MTKTKSTKRALLTSALALLLCVSMLIGSTFAWFTDSVTSGNNIIKSGNLDIELEYWDGDSWEDVSGKANILSNELWEPGVTEVAYLRVANAGSLVLKYQLGINIINEIAGVNKDGNTFKLSDYIEFGVVEGVNGQTGAYSKDDAGRAAAIKAVTDAKKISAGYTKAATMDPADELYLALVVYMPTSVDNAANHNGTNVPQINLGINVYATQMTAEEDSFNDQYDVNADFVAEVKTADELASVLATGGNAKLMDNITLSEGENLVIPEGVVAALDMNGKTIDAGYQAGSTTKHAYAIENRGTLTLKNGTVNARGIANYGALKIEDGVYNAVDNNGGAAIWNYAGSNVEVNGGTFTAAQADAAPAATVMHVADGATAVVNGGTFKSDADWTYAIISYGDLTINDANVSGEHGAIAASAGELTVNGGTYEITASGHVIFSEAATITLNGGSFKHSQVGASAEGNVILYASGTAKATVNGGSYDSVEAAFAYSSMTANIAVTGGTFANKATTVYASTNGVADFVADGCSVYDNGDGTFTVMKTRSGKVAYRAYILNGSRKAVQIDLEKIYAEESFVVELWHKDTLLTTTTYAGSYPCDRPGYTTCCVAMPGSAFFSWDTIHADGVTLSEDNIPDTIKVYADGILVDTFTHSSGTVFGDKVNDYLAMIAE